MLAIWASVLVKNRSGNFFLVLVRSVELLWALIEKKRHHVDFVLLSTSFHFSSLQQIWMMFWILTTYQTLSIFRYYTHKDAVDCVNFLNRTKLDNRVIRTDLDPGFREGRQYGRGKSGGQVNTLCCVIFLSFKKNKTF